MLNNRLWLKRESKMVCASAFSPLPLCPLWPVFYSGRGSLILVLAALGRLYGEWFVMCNFCLDKVLTFMNSEFNTNPNPYLQFFFDYMWSLSLWVKYVNTTVSSGLWILSPGSIPRVQIYSPTTLGFFMCSCVSLSICVLVDFQWLFA